MSGDSTIGSNGVTETGGILSSITQLFSKPLSESELEEVKAAAAAKRRAAAAAARAALAAERRADAEARRKEAAARVRRITATNEDFTSGSEPGWMQRISNSTICNWFYTFYLANLIVFILIISMSAYIYFSHKRHATMPNLFFALLQLVVAGTNMLFFYLICDRSLKPSL
jgi:ribosomal protein L12E/L44/L45/RPP1/RPP2